MCSKSYIGSCGRRYLEPRTLARGSLGHVDPMGGGLNHGGPCGGGLSTAPRTFEIRLVCKQAHRKIELADDTRRQDECVLLDVRVVIAVHARKLLLIGYARSRHEMATRLFSACCRAQRHLVRLC